MVMFINGQQPIKPHSYCHKQNEVSTVGKNKSSDDQGKYFSGRQNYHWMVA